MGDSIIKETLKILSCNNGWSYGVFWRLDPKNSLLTLQNVYCEEGVEHVIEDTLLPVHIVGQGVIGQAAFTKSHRWLFSDSHSGELSSQGTLRSCDAFQDDFEFDRQFSSGIQTIVVISVEELGVAHFGSTQKIEESLELVSQTKDLFRSIQLLEGLVSSIDEPLSSHLDNGDTSEVLASLISYQHGDGFQGFIDSCCSMANMSEAFPSTLEYGKIGPLCAESPSCENRLRTANAEAQVDQLHGNESNIQLQQSDTVHGGFFELPASECPRNNTWDGSTVEESSMVCNSDLLFMEELSRMNFSKALSRRCTNDDLLQWFSPMVDRAHDSEVVTLSSNPREHHIATKIESDSLPSVPLQSSVINSLYSAGKADFSDTFRIDQRSHCSGLGIGCKTSRDWEDIKMPVEMDGHLDVKASSSESISRQYVDSRLRTSNTLFSNLGLYQRLDEIDRCFRVVSGSDFRDGFYSTAKRRKIGSLGNTSSVEAAFHINSSKNGLSKDIRSLESGSCVADNGSIITGKTVASPNKLEQPAKPIKKKAKPGAKPRPKDRHQIHDRLLELRELIPNGQKMSIDRLLYLTIKHLLFLQSVTRHAESFQPTEEAKSGMAQKDKHHSCGGVIWACEVEDQTVICPLIVEDLNVPGQMLIEILCEEQGFFLEIVDAVRGFGLAILKGVMELRENKIWARFNVVAKENLLVTRHDIFSSLIQVLNLTSLMGFHKKRTTD